jgi:hypothetical protein
VNEDTLSIEIPNPIWKEKPGIFLKKHLFHFLVRMKFFKRHKSIASRWVFLKAAGTVVQLLVSKDFYRAICWQSQQ